MITKQVFILLVLSWAVNLHAQEATPIIVSENISGSGQSLLPESATAKYEGPTDAPGVINRTVLPTNGSNSHLSRAPSNFYNFQRTEYLITPYEMAVSGFPSGGEITSIWFYIYTAGVGTLTGTLNIYLKNTTDVAYSLGTGWTTAGFTQVCSKTNWTAPISGSWYEISFTGGLPFTYTGGGVYIAWEYTAPGTPGTTAVWHYTNTTMANSIYSARSNTEMPTTLEPESYRPATAFTNPILFDVLGVTHIYTLEKVAVPFGCPPPLTVRVVNYSAANQTFNLTVTIKDPTNTITRYTSTQTISNMPASSSGIVTFSGWNPTITENVTITANATIMPGETHTTNNTLTINSSINSALLSYNFAFPTSVIAGFTYPSTGILAAKYTMNGTGQVSAVNIAIANADVNTGNIIYAVLLNATGTILAQTPNYTIVPGDLGNWKTFTLSAPVTFTNEQFYVGLAQTTGSAQWLPMAAANENPLRATTFYLFSLTGGTPSLLSNQIKFGLEAQVAPIVTTVHDVGVVSIDPRQVYPEGISYPEATVKNFGNVTETFTVNLMAGSYSSTQTVTALAPGDSVVVTFAPWNASAGFYIMVACTQLPTDENLDNDCMNQPVYVKVLDKEVYGYITDPGSGTLQPGPVTFNAGDPGTLQVIAGQPSLAPLAAGAWVNGEWFAAEKSATAPYNLVKINTTTGSRTVIGNMGAPVRGISYNPVNGILYGVSATGLYTINRSTGQATLVGSISGSSLAALAIHKTGQAYGADMLNDRLVALNLSNGQATAVGPLLFDAGEDLDMEFDTAAGNLYMTAGTPDGGTLRWVDRNNGNALLIGYFEDGATICGLAVPSGLTLPTVTTTPISGVTDHTANGGGTVITIGSSPVTERGICWSTSPNPTISDSHSSNGTGTGSFTSQLTGLSPCSTYYVRAYATNSAGTAYGESVSFCTFCITTTSVTNITSTTATSGGNITCGGSSAITARGVCWSTSVNPTTANSKTTNGTGAGSFNSSLTGLSPATTYHVRAYATNTEGTFYGSDLVFQTPAKIPVVVTTPVTNVTASTASSGGNVTNNGGATVTVKGVCWNTTGNPTISDPHSSDGTGNGSYISAITGLPEYTEFYVKAYATNSVGTGYGQEVLLRTLPAACGEDITYEGKTYQTVQIGDQCWMKQNLNVGTMINSNLEQTDNDTIEKYCYDNLESNCDVYGGLYQWNEIIEFYNAFPPPDTPHIHIGDTYCYNEKLCPSGWHLSTSSDWENMSTILGGVNVAGGKLKETGYNHWAAPNSGATNNSNFTALPGGQRFYDGNMYDMAYYGYFWMNDWGNFNTSGNAWLQIVSFNNDNLESLMAETTNGFSVRCVKDYLPPQDVLVIQDTVLTGFLGISCFNALDTIMTPDNGTSFIVHNGEHAILIAGHSIKLLPGVKVLQGAYLHGYISENGVFCPGEYSSCITYWKNAYLTNERESLHKAEFSKIMIYPNPTFGDFIIEFRGKSLDETAELSIYNIHGEQLLRQKITTAGVNQVSLAGKAAGVYFVRMVSGSKVETKLLVKQN